MIIEMNVQYSVKPGKEKRILEILRDLRSEDTDCPHEILRKELFWGGHSDEEISDNYISEHRDTASQI